MDESRSLNSDSPYKYRVLDEYCDFDKYRLSQTIANSLSTTEEENVEAPVALSVETLSVRPLSSNPSLAQRTSISVPVDEPSQTAAAQPSTTTQAGATASTADDLLNAAQKCMDPCDVPFSTMIGKCRPLFLKNRVLKKNTCSLTQGGADILPSTVPNSTNAEKRPTPAEGRPRLFSKKRQEHEAQRPKQVDPVNLSEELPSSSSPRNEAPAEGSNPNPSFQEGSFNNDHTLPYIVIEDGDHSPVVDLLPKGGADSSPLVNVNFPASLLTWSYTLSGGLMVSADSTLWSKSEAFQAFRPLILGRVRKDFDEAHDPMEVQASVTLYLIKSLACRAGLLEKERVESSVKEVALQLKMREVQEENENLKDTVDVAKRERREAHELCMKEVEKNELLNSCHVRLEAEHVLMAAK
ncbi:hypothetical protein LIER_08899 [Lithospermum erythrorhizon]|uniref:Uncharacterized protein n=1 Tax=Lithospermum erythrorhizon TaxID=34254 RepID=A0AAV3PFQ1_LITER